MRISIEEAKALWLNVDAVSIHENMVRNAVDRCKSNIRKRDEDSLVKKAKKPRKTLEDNDAERLAFYLNKNWYRFVHTPNESWVAGKAAMLASIKKKRMWLQKGYPDFTIYMKSWNTLHIELKKKRTKKADWTYYALSTDGIKCSEDQKEWIEYLNTRKWHHAEFCFWYDESIQCIIDYEKF